MAKKPSKNEVKHHVDELMLRADKTFTKSKEEANRFVAKARRLAMKHRMSLPRQWKRRVCKHCYKLLKPGVNSRVRISSGKVVILCMECKKFTRILLHSKR